MPSNIYESLRESHDVQRDLCKRLKKAANDSEQRKVIFNELRIELAAHTAAEERFLYAPILMKDAGLNSSRHALAEHHELDELVEKIQEFKDSSRKWPKLIGQLIDDVKHHLKEEETKFFQVSGKILNETQKQKLATQYEHDYRRMKKSL